LAARKIPNALYQRIFGGRVYARRYPSREPLALLSKLSRSCLAYSPDKLILSLLVVVRDAACALFAGCAPVFLLHSSLKLAALGWCRVYQVHGFDIGAPRALVC